MPKVYRLENPATGKGNYNDHLADYARTSSYNNAYHPSPREETGELYDWFRSNRYDETTHYFCGFASKRQMWRWFPKKKLAQMVADGSPIQLKVYKVSRKYFKRGVCQVMFRKKNARLLTTTTPDKLKEL